MFESLSQLGTGGILALLIVREVLTFLGKKKGVSRDAGAQDVAYWNKDYRDAVREVNAETLGPRLERIERLLERVIERP